MNLKSLILSVVLLSGCSFIPANADTMSADSRFKLAMKTVLRHEGGLTNDKNDPGGWTNFGLSLRYLRAEHLDVNGDGIVSKNDVIDMTKSEAEEVYYKEWWEKFGFSKIQDQAVCTKIFDFSINAGESQSIKIAQRALNRINKNKLKVTGKMDDNTIKLINNTNPSLMLKSFRSEEADFYRAIVKKNKKLSVFLSGWLRRAAD